MHGIHTAREPPLRPCGREGRRRGCQYQTSRLVVGTSCFILRTERPSALQSASCSDAPCFRICPLTDGRTQRELCSARCTQASAATNRLPLVAEWLGTSIASRVGGFQRLFYKPGAMLPLTRLSALSRRARADCWAESRLLPVGDDLRGTNLPAFYCRSV